MKNFLAYLSLFYWNIWIFFSNEIFHLQSVFAIFGLFLGPCQKEPLKMLGRHAVRGPWKNFVGSTLKL